MGERIDLRCQMHSRAWARKILSASRGLVRNHSAGPPKGIIFLFLAFHSSPLDTACWRCCSSSLAPSLHPPPLAGGQPVACETTGIRRRACVSAYHRNCMLTPFFCKREGTDWSQPKWETKGMRLNDKTKTWNERKSAVMRSCQRTTGGEGSCLEKRPAYVARGHASVQVILGGKGKRTAEEVRSGEEKEDPRGGKRTGDVIIRLEWKLQGKWKREIITEEVEWDQFLVHNYVHS